MKVIPKYFFPVIAVFAFNILTSNAQEISAESFAKVKDYLVGDRINVTLIVKRPENFTVEWRKQDPDPTRLELVDSIVKDSAIQKGLEKIDILLPLAGFDSGTAVYPAQLFIFRKHGDTSSFTLKTKPITFHISSITVDLKKDIKPIVGPVEPGPDWRTIILYIIAGLVVIALIVAGYLLWRKYSKRKQETIQELPEIKRPSWEIAVEKLAQLQKDDLPSKGWVKEYYISLSHILKEFISEKLGIDGLELTTEELAEILKIRMISPDSREKLFYILELSDSVKFAKYIPNASDHEKSMAMAYKFVEEMREGSGEIGNDLINKENSIIK